MSPYVSKTWSDVKVNGYSISFINDSDRIANCDYQPTDDDVIRARLRTLGVQEYRFIFDHGLFIFFFLSSRY